VLKMEPTQIFETSDFNTQTPGKYQEDNLSLLQHGENLKTRIDHLMIYIRNQFILLNTIFSVRN
jgi:hypothetical protein